MADDRLDTAVQCEGTTKSGKRCGQMTRNPDRWCGLCVAPSERGGAAVDMGDIAALSATATMPDEDEEILDSSDASAAAEDADAVWARVMRSHSSDQEQVLITAMAANDLIPVLYGEPGIGKTETVKSIARDLDSDIQVVVISQLDPSDVAGQPFATDVDSDHPHLSHLMPVWAQKVFQAAEEGRRSVVFFDELDKAAPANQNAALTILRERMIEGQYFPEDTVFVAAANPPESGGWGFSDAMANRLLHISWKVDEDKVIRGITEGSFDGSDPDIGVSEKLRDARIRARAIVGGYLAANRMEIHRRPKDDDAAGGAWPSPRSWEGLCHALAKAEVLGASKVARRQTINGAVGQGAAQSFASYMDSLDLPKPADVLEHPERFMDFRTDQLYAVVASVGSYVTSDANTSVDNVKKALKWMDGLCAAKKTDVVRSASAPMWRRLLRGDGSRSSKGRQVVIELSNNGDLSEGMAQIVSGMKDAHLLPSKSK